MRALPALLALALSCAVPAHAQLGFGGDLPIDVRAERATYQGGLTVLEDNVVVVQDTTTVSADRMDIYRDETGGDNSPAGSLSLGAITRIEAEGNFEFANPDNTITGRRGVYYADRDIFIVTDDVVLVQPGGSSVRGSRMVYNLVTGSALFGTPCETGTAAQGECERVAIRIEP